MRKDPNLEREIRRGWHKSYLKRYGEERFRESFPVMHAYLKKTKRLGQALRLEKL